LYWLVTTQRHEVTSSSIQIKPEIKIPLSGGNAGISPLHLHALLGQSWLEMVRHNAQMVDEDLLQAHKQASPIDHLGNFGKTGLSQS